MVKYLLFCTFLFFVFHHGFAQEDPITQSGYEKLNMHDFEGAIQDFSQVLSQKPGNMDALCGRAEARINLEDYDNATIDLDAVLSADANNSKAYALKGDILYDKKDYQGALKLYEKSLQGPNPPTMAVIGKSKVLNQTGNSREAFKVLDEAISREPANAELYYARGILYSTKARFSRSLDDFNKALIVNPDQNAFGDYLNRGIAYLNLQEPDSAINDLTRALAIDPRSAIAYHTRGVAHYQMGDYQQSTDDFLKSSELNPNNPVTYYNLGMSYYKLGDKENACVYFHKSCQSGNTEACKMIILNCSER